MSLSLSGAILGVVNIAITVAILLLIGLVIVWIVSWLGAAVPANVQRMYVLIVALVALYMVVALLFGLPSVGLTGGIYRLR